MTFTDAGKRRCLRDHLLAMFFPATGASLNAQLAGDDRLLNGKEDEVNTCSRRCSSPYG